MSLIVLFTCVIFIIGLFARDRKLRPMDSWGLWIALIWITIIGSRFVSSWFGVTTDLESADEILEGSPLDRYTFLVLIVVGFVVLLRRKPDWKIIFNSNRWFFIFFIYCCISIIWSDYPFVSFKRWIKELGNVIMVLIVLTEKDVIRSTRAVIARYTYLVIPLSIVLIYVFPDIGIYYDDGFVPIYGGVSTNKNILGLITLVCGLFLFWEILYMRSVNGNKIDVLDFIVRCLLLLMTGWLVYLAKSMTALGCLILGIGLLLCMKIPFVRGQAKYLGTYSLLLSIPILLLLSFSKEIIKVLLPIIGRDMTFTGRTDIWADVVNERLNPLIGTGYQSFWLGTRVDDLWSKYSLIYQAHNGYLETYLNGGLVGLSLLIALIIQTGIKLKKELLLENKFGILLFVVLIISVLYSATEAIFSRVHLVWFVLSIAALYYPNQRELSTSKITSRKFSNKVAFDTTAPSLYD